MDPPLVFDPPSEAEDDASWERGILTHERPRLRLPAVRGPEPRPIAAVALLFAGSFLLFLCLLLPMFVAPREARAALAPYWVIAAEGSGSYLSVARGEVVASDRLKVTRTVRGDLDAGSEQTAVYDAFTALEDLGPDVSPDDRVVWTTDQRIALDRRTGEAVACCDEQPAHEGLTLRFPFGTRRATYPLWDDEIADVRPATYVRTQRMDGLEVYLFSSQVEPTVIISETVRGALVGLPDPSIDVDILYAADKQLWVEPRTGRIVNARSVITQTLQPADAVATTAMLELAWNQDTVDWMIRDTRRSMDRLALVATTGPTTALVTGCILLLAGIWLAARSQRHRRHLQRGDP